MNEASDTPAPLTITLVSFVVGGLREEMWRAGTLAAMRVLWPRIFGFWRGQFLAVTLIAVAAADSTPA